MERLSTGVLGLDELIEGGIVKNSVVLVTGKTGTGKTLFCSSFLYEGARNGEKGLYITTEETEEDIVKDVQSTFSSWEFEKCVEEGMIKIISVKPSLLNPEQTDVSKFLKLYIYSMLEKAKEITAKENVKRMVIDSVSMIEMFLRDPYIARIGLAILIDEIKKLNVTALLTSTIEEGTERLSGSGIIEYLVDGVIKLDFVPVTEEFQRTLVIRKMRRTDHSTLIHPFKITPYGIEVIKPEEIDREFEGKEI